MSKKVMISICKEPLGVLVKDNFGNDFYNRVASNNGSIRLLYPSIYNDTLATILEEENINIPDDFIKNTRILELPDGYDIIENFNDADDIQVSVIIGKDLKEIITYDIEEGADLLSEEEEEKLKDFIVPFKFEDK